MCWTLTICERNKKYMNSFFFLILQKKSLLIKGGIYFSLNPKKGHTDDAVEWDVYSWVYIFTRSSSLHDH
jgi:hypothetical protein